MELTHNKDIKNSYSLETIDFPMKLDRIDISSQRRVEEATQIAIETLQKVQRNGPIKIEKFPQLIQLKTFLKKASHPFPNLNCIQQCNRELLSLRLGIQPHILDQNPHFEMDVLHPKCKREQPF